MEKKNEYRREYYRKNREEEVRKAKERYFRRKEREGKEDRLPGRPRKYNKSDDDKDKKEIAEESRLRYYIGKIKQGKDFDIEKMSPDQKRDLAVACLRMENEHLMVGKKVSNVRSKLSELDKNIDLKSESEKIENGPEYIFIETLVHE